MSEVWRDLRYGLRLLTRARGFTILTVVTLALGIGATTAIVSLVRAFFFTPLAVEEASRLVDIHQTLAQRPDNAVYEVALPDYWYYRDRTRTVSELAAHYPTAPLHLVAGAATAETTGSVVTANYFATLRLRPHLGRFFLASEDEVPDRDFVAVIGHDLWQRQFDGDPSIVGRTIGLNGKPFTVVGVAPAGFDGAMPGILRSQVWIPTAMFHTGYRYCDAFRTDCRIVNLFGRLEPGATVADAQAEWDVLARQLAQASPATHDGRGIRVRLARGVRLTEQAGHTLTARLLLAIVGCVLLMACANVAGLLLARNVTRRKEIAIRLALGAGRWRLLRQLLIESLLLAALGGACGALLAIWANELLRTSFGTSYAGTSMNFSVPLDATVLGVTIVLSIGVGLAFGLVPAWLALRPGVAPVIKEETAGGGSTRLRARDALVVVQVAASVMLLVGAALLVRSLAGIQRGPGFDADRVVVLRTRPGLAGYASGASRAYHQEAMRRLESLPGVRAASLAQALPLPTWGRSLPIARADETAAAPTTAITDRIGARYFEALGVALVGGREFDARDRQDAPPVAIVNETLARRLWPRAQPVGASLLVDGLPHEIVGVVRDAQYLHAGEGPRPAVYLNYWQVPLDSVQVGDARLTVRVAGDVGAMLGRIRQALIALDPQVPVAEAAPLSTRIGFEFRRVHIVSMLVASSSALALFLSATGLYGLLSFAVNQRRRELAIRTALGAERRDLARLVARQSLRLAGTGAVIGLLGAVASAQVLAALLYGVQPYDPMAMVAAVAALLAVAVVATFVPMRRAAAVDPIIALRNL